ncbi:MAG: hypothetical protein JW987_17125 [Anaerolineaceae bacterium]|nr:hypothetical protein [Anaerolineaceae bacterium]
MITKRQSERGQVVVFLVIVLVALLGFSALAIDGGMIYADRRLAQTAADAAAMAGVGVAARSMDDQGLNSSNFSCSSSKVSTAMNSAAAQAISRALANDFDIDADISDNMGVEVTCHIDNKGYYQDKYLDVRVVLDLDTRTSFAHLFTGTESVTNTVEAVARVRPRSPLAFGNAIVALGSGCGKGSGGIEYDGGGSDSVTVTGGGIFSNTCITFKGGVDIKTQCDTDKYPGCTERPPMSYTTTYTQSGGSASILPTPQKVSGGLPPLDIPVPNCDDPKATKHMSQIKLNSGHDTFTFSPGLHCLYGGIKATGGKLFGTGVTLVIVNGDFDTAGNAQVQLSAPDEDGADTDGDGVNDEADDELPALRGILIYMLASNSGEIQLSGNSDSWYQGTVYAPSGLIEAGGNSAALETLSTQLIGESVKLHGSTHIDIRFDADENYPTLPKMELAK